MEEVKFQEKVHKMEAPLKKTKLRNTDASCFSNPKRPKASAAGHEP